MLDVPLFLNGLCSQPPSLFASVVNKIASIFHSNAAAFQPNQEGWGQWLQDYHSYSKLGSFYLP